MGLNVDIYFKDNKEYLAYFGNEGAFLQRFLNKEELDECSCDKEITAKDLKTAMLNFVKETLASFNHDFTEFNISEDKTLYIDQESEYFYRVRSLPNLMDKIKELKTIDDERILIMECGW